MAARKVLLVEGDDDEHVMKHICGHGGLKHLDEIVNAGGVAPLLESLPVRLKESDVEALGVVLDADDDISARWEAVRDLLRKSGYDAPSTPDTEGTIVSRPGEGLLPRVGVWVMPDNRENGLLEDFLRFLVPSDSVLMKHVESSVDAIPREERRFRTVVRSKAIVHTWLAWQREPGKPLGTAITARYLDANVAEVDVLLGWLRRLFAL